MSLRITSICPDGMIYVTAAKALEAGNWKSASGEMSLNIYPAILTVLHRLGLDWEFAASLWGVTVSSLVVLPLWGWVRRQFDDRVALAACFLYIIHPKFIEWSPEVLRDPTFWFFFTLAIYWLWRAVTEVHYGYFIAGGAAVILASLTRVEGLFLLIPLTLWTFWRYRSLQTNRKKLIIGVVLCIVVLPSLLALANLIFLFERAGWGALRLNPFGRGFVWLGSLMGRTPATSMTGIPNEPLTLGQMLWKFFPAMTRGLSPVYALLMFGGIWRWRRLWVRRDHQPLFYVAHGRYVWHLGSIVVRPHRMPSLCPAHRVDGVAVCRVGTALVHRSIPLGCRSVALQRPRSERNRRRHCGNHRRRKSGRCGVGKRQVAAIAPDRDGLGPLGACQTLHPAEDRRTGRPHSDCLLLLAKPL